MNRESYFSTLDSLLSTLGGRSGATRHVDRVEVIGAGFGRTGTTSLKAALEELGFGPAYHMTEAFKNPEHAGFWEAALRGEPVDWRGFFAGHGAAVDWPACTFYAQILEAFPDAKVILTLRDPERWYESVRNTIYGIRKLSAGPMRPAVALFGLFAPGIVRIVRLADRIMWNGTFGDRFEDKDYAIETFHHHNAEVRRRVPPERLLVYDVEEGWGPLCGFLGVGIPDKPFPHLNDTREMRRRLLGLVGVFAAPPVLAIVGLVAALLVRSAGRR